MATSFSRRIMRSLCRGLIAGALGTATFAILDSTLVQTHSAWAASNTPAKTPTAPIGQPHEICTYWDKNLTTAPDPVNGFRQTPCLVGRMILFGQKNTPVCCEGSLTVKLWDERPMQGGSPIHLETWNINAENLRKMIFVDALGMWGYTLALPTETVTPNLSHARLEVFFTPAEPKGAGPLFAQAGNIRLDYSSLLQKTGNALPAGFQQPGYPAGYPQQYIQQPAPQMGMPNQQMPMQQMPMQQMPMQYQQPLQYQVPMQYQQPMPGQYPQQMQPGNNYPQLPQQPQGGPGYQMPVQPAGGVSSSMMAPRYPQPTGGDPMMAPTRPPQLGAQSSMPQQSMIPANPQPAAPGQLLVPVQYQVPAVPPAPLPAAPRSMVPPMPQ